MHILSREGQFFCFFGFFLIFLPMVKGIVESVGKTGFYFGSERMLIR